jgi:peptide/nickel transport system substrate-binding protein
LFKKKYAKASTKFSIKKANKLLDEMGLTKRNDDGIRLLPNGEPMEIIVETAGEDTEQTDVLELIGSTWKKVGIKLFSKPLQREVFRNRIFSGKAIMSVWGGLENGLPTADMSPRELAPTNQLQFQWPKWGQYFESGGAAGEKPDMPAAEELLALNAKWLAASDTKSRAKIWDEMLAIRAEQVFSIGLISGVPQPVVINKNLKNVPAEGMYNWDPGAHFGMYRPDTFWLQQ